jgi:hypothetical protein
MHALVTPDGAADPGGALPGPFGPRTPGTQTAGVAEAIRALVGRQGGGVVEIEPAGSYPLTATLEVPSNITLRSAMGGGEAYGPKIVPPIGTLRWNASGGPALLFGPGVTRATLEGIAVIGDTPTALVWRSGCRQVTFRDVCLQNASGPALQSDGARGANTEDCAVERAYLEGAPALQLGAPGETQRSNNCRWVDVTAEGPQGRAAPTGVVHVLEGGNHQFHNFFSRGPGTQIVVDAGTLFLHGGELLAKGVLLQQNGGEVTLSDLTVTSGEIHVAGGKFKARNIRAYKGASIEVSGGSAVADRFSDLWWAARGTVQLV